MLEGIRGSALIVATVLSIGGGSQSVQAQATPDIVPWTSSSIGIWSGRSCGTGEVAVLVNNVFQCTNTIGFAGHSNTSNQANQANSASVASVANSLSPTATVSASQIGGMPTCGAGSVLTYSGGSLACTSSISTAGSSGSLTGSLSAGQISGSISGSQVSGAVEWANNATNASNLGGQSASTFVAGAGCGPVYNVGGGNSSSGLPAAAHLTVVNWWASYPGAENGWNASGYAQCVNGNWNVY
jgi:hypothetical protein